MIFGKVEEILKELKIIGLAQNHKFWVNDQNMFGEIDEIEIFRENYSFLEFGPLKKAEMTPLILVYF